MRDLDIGMSMVWEPSSDRVGPPVARYAFELATFSPKQSVARPDQLSLFWQDRYLFWKTADKREEVPKFDAVGVRDEVLKAWKLGEARKFALKKANVARGRGPRCP